MSASMLKPTMCQGCLPCTQLGFLMGRWCVTRPPAQRPYGGVPCKSRNWVVAVQHRFLGLGSFPGGIRETLQEAVWFSYPQAPPQSGSTGGSPNHFLAGDASTCDLRPVPRTVCQWPGLAFSHVQHPASRRLAATSHPRGRQALFTQKCATLLSNTRIFILGQVFKLLARVNGQRGVYPPVQGPDRVMTPLWLISATLTVDISSSVS